MKKYYIPLLLIIMVITSYGSAQPVNLVISTYSGSSVPNQYTVPSGKILVITAISHSVSGSPPTKTNIQLSIKYDNVSLTFTEAVTIKESFSNGEWVLLSNHIRLKAGDRIFPNAGNQYRVMGILIDEADLYAANLPVELDNTRVVANKLMADAKVKSARPHKITVQSSPDMTDFDQDPTSTVVSTGTTGISVVSVDKGSTGKKFIRVSAQTRSTK